MILVWSFFFNLHVSTVKIFVDKLNHLLQIKTHRESILQHQFLELYI